MLNNEGTLPLIPIKDSVIFPNVITPISIGRQKSIKAAQTAIEGDGYVILTLQNNLDVEEPTLSDIHTIGVQAKILQYSYISNSNMRILIDAVKKVKILNIENTNDYLQAQYQVVPSILYQDDKEEVRKKIAHLIFFFTIYIQLNKAINKDAESIALDKAEPSIILDMVCAQLACQVQEKQALLEEENFDKKINLTISYLKKALPILEIEKEIEEKVQLNIEKSQREFYIKEKIQALQKELEKSTGISDTASLEEKIKTINLSPEAKIKVESEMQKYKSMNPLSSEASILRNYLEVLVSLPWGKVSTKDLDINEAKAILDEEHYGLEEIKETILEYISAIKRTPKISNSVLLFVGPSGTGKTSLVKTIAKALGREYVKCSLGGVHSEAEIRGHRRTYIGSMPGKIISALQKVKTDNPVILLDEIDKMGSDFRGDPSAAFLEILDFGQNNQFLDNYLAVEYDLSKVIFICTANSLNIPKPLLDRMGVINISGYTQKEKLAIAMSHLLPKQLKIHAIEPSEFTITEGAVESMIKFYTREAGVRELERQIAALIRKIIKFLLLNTKKVNLKITANNITKFLGPIKYTHTKKDKELDCGSALGLAYTEYGGELLAIEAVLVPGEGELKSTGKIGEVMKESTEAAFSYFKSIAPSLGVDREKYTKNNLHIHFPEGATPKDGPSAGIAIFATIASLMLNIKPKASVAMTGEITLKGKVLEIGGLKEKLLAAYSSDIKTVLIPTSNIKDLAKIPSYIKHALKIIPIEDAKQVLEIALEDFEMIKASVAI